MNFEDLIWLFSSNEHSRGIVRLNIAEGALLYKCVKSLSGKPATLVEIGRKNGGSTVLMAASLHPASKLYSIDIKPLQSAYDNVAKCGLSNQVVFINKDSHSARKEWNEGSIDLLFIDGDHSYKGVKSDINDWCPLVNIGGMVIFHDVIGKKHELQPLIKKLIRGGWKEIDRADSALCLRKESP